MFGNPPTNTLTIRNTERSVDSIKKKSDARHIGSVYNLYILYISDKLIKHIDK